MKKFFLNINSIYKALIFSFILIAFFLCKNAKTIGINYQKYLYKINEININYILPSYICQTKNELYSKFFSELYYYTITNHSSQINRIFDDYNIHELKDILYICQKYKKGIKNMQVVGELFGNFFAKKSLYSNFKEQLNYDTFISYCINNNKFIDFLYFAKEFFYHWRIDEGYTYIDENSKGTNPFGSDFFANPDASIIDIAKFFYYSKETLPDYMLASKNITTLYDKIPGILKNTFNQQQTYDTKNNKEYVTPNNFDVYGFTFDGWYTNKNLSGNTITIINDNTIKSLGNNITLYAKFNRIGEFANEIKKDFPYIEQQAN